MINITEKQRRELAVMIAVLIDEFKENEKSELEIADEIINWLEKEVK